MTKLLLSTSNVMGGGPSIIRRPPAQKSNAEFTSGLRANFAIAQETARLIAEEENKENGVGRVATANGSSPNSNNKKGGGGGQGQKKPDYKDWTRQDDDDGYLYIPAISFEQSGLAEERSQYEITVKLFFLPNNPTSCRCAQARSAINLVLKELHMPSIDLLIVSFPGVSFDAEDEDEDNEEDHHHQQAAAMTTKKSENAAAKVEDLDSMLTTWSCLEDLHGEGVIGKLGVAEFGTARLAQFLQKARIRPSVNQINVRDCCVVPKPLILYAKREKIDLLTHSDSTNILPEGTVRELLGQGETGAGVLAADTSTTSTQEGLDGLKGNVEPQWVIKYTAVVKDRGVIENKGYFAMAELSN